MINIRNLSFSYEREILKNISFNVNKGEYIALMGENGCGKSTLVSCINGLLTPPAGAVLVNGLDVSAAIHEDDTNKNPSALRQIRTFVGTVTQNPDSQIVGSSVEEDAAFGAENLALHETEIKKRVENALADVDLAELWDHIPQTLSGGEKQRLAIAGVLAVQSPCLLLDEPSSMLDSESTAKLLSLMDDLNAAGKTIIHITHDLKHAARARRCLVLHKGTLVFDGIPMHLLQSPELERWGLKANFTNPPRKTAPEQTAAIRFDSVSFSYSKDKNNRKRFQIHGKQSGGLTNVTLHIPQSSTVAVIGKSGCGKTTLLKHINGLLKPNEGTVSIAGKPFLRAALAIQSPESALFETYVADDVAFAPKNAKLKGKPLVQAVKTAMKDAGLPFTDFADRETRALSGGEKRRAALAGALAMDSKIILLDEPLAGLDAKNRAHALNMIFEQQAKGKTVVAVIHSLDAVEFFDFALAMDKGRVTAFGTPSVVLNAGAAVKAGAAYAQTSLGEASSHSFLQKLGAGKKLLALLGLCSVALTGNLFFPAGTLVAALLAGVFLGGASASFLLKQAFSNIPLLGVIVLLQLAFDWTGDESRVLVEFFISITAAEVYRSVSIIIRVLAVSTCLTLYIAVTPLRETLRVVNRSLAHIRFLRGRDIAMALGISLRWTPILAEEAERIRTAQLSRGGKKGLRGAFAIVIPLLLRALEKSETLASALLLRLYPPQSTKPE
ncbi:MAG: ATP-binding cassette domain-containing protein [Treponema sp.]|jgi:energy-coupling factor transport system ATP-binding protein|nr:ATP-binding cassette domain-containing protein [Treponema sp.]